MKKQHLWRATAFAGGCLMVAFAQAFLSPVADAQTCSSGQHYNGPVYTYPQRQIYTQPGTVYHPGRRTIYYRPRVYHQPYAHQQYHRPDCPLHGTTYPPGTIIGQPIDSRVIVPESVIQNPQTEITGEWQTGPEPGSSTKGGGEKENVVQPPQPWQQWADMPPLRGDFPAMIHQVVGDVDWLLVAHGDKFSPDVKSLLGEGKQYLDTSCQVCDEDTDLFAGTEAGDETVRDVTSQLKEFRDLVGRSLQQPQMQQLQQMAAPARADKSQLGKVFGSLDADGKSKMFAMFALETLQKRADSLVAAAEAVEQGTFRPVDVDVVANELKVGDMAPDFTLQTIDGETMSLRNLKGKNAVLVFNRGHFCPYCMNQVKQLMGVAERLREQDAEVVVVFRELKPGTEVKDGIEGLRGFKQKASPPFTMAIDFGSNATSQYSTEGHFSSYVIDKDGKVASVLRGVKYIRPSGDAILKAATAANETTVSLN